MSWKAGSALQLGNKGETPCLKGSKVRSLLSPAAQKDWVSYRKVLRAARMIPLYSIMEPYFCTTVWLESANILK